MAVLEAATVYGYWFRHRSVEEVARYFGFVSPNSRSVDISSDLRPVRFERGFVQQARRAPIVRPAMHWFDLAPSAVAIDGVRPDLRNELRGAHASTVLRMLGTASYPIYMTVGDRGGRFVPAMDPSAFLPSSGVGFATRLVRTASQRAFGLRASAR